MTSELDRIYTNAIDLFNKLKPLKITKTKPSPLIWMQEDLYNEFKDKNIISEDQQMTTLIIMKWYVILGLLLPAIIVANGVVIIYLKENWR